MKLKMVALFLILFSCLKIEGMEGSEEIESQTQDEVGWKDLPDELKWIVLSFSVEENSLSDAFKRLRELSLLEKQCSNVNKDISLLIRVIIFHMDTEDYQNVLNKILFRGACIGDNNLIEMLAKVPAAPKRRRLIDMEGDSEIEPLESEVNDSMQIKLDSKEMNFLEANVNNVDAFGYTPFLHASEKGHKKIVQKFLNHNTLVLVKNKDDDTALIIASRQGFLKIVKKLLFLEGARNDINARGFGKDTAFLAVAKECLHTCDKDREDNYLEILKLLASHGADVNVSDGVDLSVMDLATKKGKVRLIDMLLDLGAHFTKHNKAQVEICLLGVPKNEEIVELLDKIKAFEVRFVKVKKVKLQLKHEPCALSFKIDEELYKTESENKPLNLQFAEKISKLDNEVCTKIGITIIEKVFAKGTTPNSIIKNSSYDLNDYRLALQFIFSQSLFESYFHSEEMNDQIAMKKIREIVKPIFKAFPDKSNNIYGNFCKYYGLK